MRCRAWKGLILLSLCLAGCGDHPADSSVTSTGSDAVESEPSTASPHIGRDAVPLDIKGWEEIRGWIANQQGKVVVVDVWSTYCAPCLKEFPHFVDLHKTHAEQVACASVSVDYYGGKGSTPTDVRPQVAKFLKSQNATMQNFISADPDETLLQRIGVTAVPAVLVYDREGKLRHVFSNDEGEYGADGFSYQKDIVPLVEGLL